MLGGAQRAKERETEKGFSLWVLRNEEAPPYKPHCSISDITPPLTASLNLTFYEESKQHSNC